MPARPALVILALTFIGTAPIGAQAPTAEHVGFFETKIRPVLAEHCYSCHSAEAKKLKGGLRLDYRDGLRKGGDSGPAIVAGKPDESLLIKAIRHGDEDLKMPPNGKLPPAVIADLEAWVRMGAPDPRDKAAPAKTAATWDEVLRTRRQWWSLQPVGTVAVPAVKNAAWSEHPVDRFLLAKLEQSGLQPAAPAAPPTLLRRLSLVLTGLPPTAAEVEKFIRDCRFSNDDPQSKIKNEKSRIEMACDKVWSKWVDQLLDSPHFGERWARHWMDVVRFSETHGNEWNYDVHHAWRYRDYLIRAFNDDVPFDRLLREHIAGDLLPPRWNAKAQINEAPIGTAFYRFGEVNHDDCIGLRSLGYDILDNQIDTLGKAFQATTIACARCHDHKIDAVSMKDYYAMLGILRSSRPVSHTINAAHSNEARIQQMRDLQSKLHRELATIWAKDVEALDEHRLDKLCDAKSTWDHPLHVWRVLRDVKEPAAAWEKLATEFRAEASQRHSFNAANYRSFGNFRHGAFDDWKWAGHGLHYGGAAPGDFTVANQGDRLIGAILPGGRFTNLYSERLNGALRSPVLPAKWKRISFRVIGEKQAAVRIVSNNCQLNYRNFKALKSGQWHWITFEIPEEAESLRCYAELMTKFDNPKYPDQLGQLGGDDTNQRVPWDKAAADPHSYFGVTRVVLHDVPQPPHDDLVWLNSLFTGAAPRDRSAVVQRIRDRAAHAVRVWAANETTEEDARWLAWLLQRGILGNSGKAHPALARLVHAYREVEKQLALPQITPGLADVDDGMEQPVFVRGDPKKTGEFVPRRYLDVLSPTGRHFIPQGSGRLALANALADPQNPLTARVMVNRIWHHLFGYGLVRTTDDFGRMGDTPSHPELLDWLAARFVEDGWSVKKMIRLLTTSKAFQMTSRADAKTTQVDPLNRLLHHYPARRMEAEAIRDSILATSGRLDRTLYGLSVLPYREGTNEDRRLFPGPLDGNGRRSIYIKVNLMEPARFLSAFDLPGGKVCQGRRDVTNVPAQALAMMNDPFVHQQAEFWAKSLVEFPASGAASPSERIDVMFKTALNRPPTAQENDRFVRFVEEAARLQQVPAVAVMNSIAVWRDVAHALLNVQEFIYIP